MQKIMHDLHPADQSNDFNQLAAQMAKVNQGITMLDTRMQSAEKENKEATKHRQQLEATITQRPDNLDHDQLVKDFASIKQQVAELGNTQDRQGKLQQLIKHTHTTILDILCNSIQFKSFHEFTRKIDKKFPYDVYESYFSVLLFSFL